MKFKNSILALGAALLLAGCEKYDDSALVARMDKAEADIKELQTLVGQINTTLSGLATTVDALQKQDRIVSVTKLDDGSGYVVEFSQSGKITIYNGKNGIDGKDGKDGTNGTDGTNGQDGKTPTIGVKLDADGNYYWTVNGDYLLDENGNKIAATAHVATPQLRINNGNFEISYNGGVTWDIIGEAGNTGAIVFSNVEDGADAVTFTLGDGTTIVIPKAGSFAINMDTDVIISAGATVNVFYTVTAADDGTVVDAFGTKGFEAEITTSSASAGKVKITAPDPLTNGKVYVIAVKGDGTTAARILTCEEGVFTLDETAFAVKVPASGGVFEVPFQTNQADPMVQVSPGYSWITHVETKTVRSGKIVFNIEENTSEEERTGQVSINFKQYTIVQEGKSATPATGGGYADLETLNGGEKNTDINNTYNSVNGWSVSSTRLVQFTTMGNARYEDVGLEIRPVLAARKGNIKGMLSSPILSGGCGIITMDYTRYTSNTGSNFTIEIKDSEGTVIKSETHSDETQVQWTRTVLNFEFNVTGDFQIVITADKCTNTKESINDDFGILALSWTGYSE